MSKSNRKAFPEIRFRPCDLREKPQFEPNRFENMEILVRFDPINVYHGRIAEREKLIKEIQEKGQKFQIFIKNVAVESFQIFLNRNE